MGLSWCRESKIYEKGGRFTINKIYKQEQIMKDMRQFTLFKEPFLERLTKKDDTIKKTLEEIAKEGSKYPLYYGENSAVGPEKIKYPFEHLNVDRPPKEERRFNYIMLYVKDEIRQEREYLIKCEDKIIGYASLTGPWNPLEMEDTGSTINLIFMVKEYSTYNSKIFRELNEITKKMDVELSDF